VPPSLQNIYKELSNDIPGFVPPKHGNLEKWTKQGVLLLNAVLTVRMKEPDSHGNFGKPLHISLILRQAGWTNFTDRTISVISQYKSGVVFMLWGAKAQAKKSLIDSSKHHLLQCAHPSPYSADRGKSMWIQN
jgi:uracil-DNA glycosylase